MAQQISFDGDVHSVFLKLSEVKAVSNTGPFMLLNDKQPQLLT